MQSGGSVAPIGTSLSLSHPVLGALTVVPIAAERSYPLRHAVLRPHQREEDMRAVDTGHPDELVLGALTGDGEVVGTGAIAPGAPPEAVAALAGVEASWRVRGMATRPDARGAGVGTAILGTLLGHARAHEGRLVWCNARVAAQRLYERAGLVTCGAPWTDPHIGPHVVMWCRAEEEPGA